MIEKVKKAIKETEITMLKFKLEYQRLKEMKADLRYELGKLKRAKR